MNVREQRRESRRGYHGELDVAKCRIPEKTISVAEHIAAAQAHGVIVLARAVLLLAEVLDQPFAAAPKPDIHSKKHAGGAA